MRAVEEVVGLWSRRAVVCVCGHKDMTAVLFTRALKGLCKKKKRRKASLVSIMVFYGVHSKDVNLKKFCIILFECKRKYTILHIQW